ncbi:MAG: 16S rRNA (adenine(1518)-N(6)/adenine(1519)-N(6))-dimethyltransferase RsmA [Patescibacteria group bacterium]
MKSVRRKRGARPRRGGARLGQHFLTGQWAARKLAEAVRVRPDETILEIGPGKGALTEELLAVGTRVVAIEKDPVLVRQLHERFTKSIIEKKLIVVEADVRDFDPLKFGLTTGKYILAANIPYYITGEIIRQFLETATQPRAMALLIQKEVAERIIARPADGGARNGKESILSLSVKAYGVPKIVAKVSRGNFSPPPNVDSAILLIEHISKEFFGNLDEKIFFKVVKAGFASKRKFLANNLAVAFGKDAVLHALKACGLDTDVRAEDVPFEKWKCLTGQL